MGTKTGPCHCHTGGRYYNYQLLLKIPAEGHGKTQCGSYPDAFPGRIDQHAVEDHAHYLRGGYRFAV